MVARGKIVNLGRRATIAILKGQQSHEEEEEDVLKVTNSSLNILAKLYRTNWPRM
jgi:hypothetical protein